jgi:hypothetical protein
MKKARIALTAIALFAVIGGALAFKFSPGNNVYTFTNGTYTLTAFGTTVPGQGVLTTTYYLTGTPPTITYTTTWITTTIVG